jgi:hypothetical protein
MTISSRFRRSELKRYGVGQHCWPAFLMSAAEADDEPDGDEGRGGHGCRGEDREQNSQTVVHGLYSGLRKKTIRQNCSYPEKGEHPQYSIDYDGLVKSYVRAIANDC